MVGQSTDPPVSTPHFYSLRSKQRSQRGAPLLLMDLCDDLIEKCLPASLISMAGAAATCRDFHRLWQRDSLARRLVLPARPLRSEPELLCLARLASAGNAAACFRLGIACVYESSGDCRYEDGVRMLRSVADSEGGSGALVGDALFEIWHLTCDAEEREKLLRRAAAAGHVAALIELHGTSKERLAVLGLQRPLDAPDVLSASWISASQHVLAAPTAQIEREQGTNSRHYCDRPGCVRWRFRKREVRLRMRLETESTFTIFRRRFHRDGGLTQWPGK